MGIATFTFSRSSALRFARTGLALLLLLSVSACGRQAPPPPQEPVEPPKPSMIEHTVQYRGETLGLIARWYTGKTTNWQEIVAANPGLRPERINLGDTIMIPAELVTNSAPLPSSAVRSSSTAKKMDTPEASTGETVPEMGGTATLGDSPAEMEAEEVDEVSVDALLGEIAAEREKRAEEAKEVEEEVSKEVQKAPELDSTVQEELPTEAVEQEPTDVSPPSDASPEDDAAERERLLDELLSQ